ncbi:MAG: alpha-L-rhamnosidase N-terminal domain-containing protein, partial [Acidobacteriota bacterium]|nr:alpha-L-rhamnosidase N-terminal domain-containing protein [Acidobacteriota bacterium]
MKRLAILLTFVLSGALAAGAAAMLKNLQVEYRATPLGIDVAQPRFGWQMDTTAGERGYTQTAYQIQVRDPKGAIVWDTNRVASAESAGITYAGTPLAAATRYTWSVTAWDQASVRLTAASWFETGLMDPAPGAAAWSGARWIGGGNKDLVLYSPYLAIFDASYTVTIAPGSTRASFVYGANDPRLMDKYKNIYQVQSARDQSYIRLELDVSGVDGTPGGKAKLKVYRAGYKDTDSGAQPLKTFDISTAVIGAANKNAAHGIAFQSAFGQITVTIDGSTTFAGAPPPPPAGRGGFPGRGAAANAVNLNPVGSGGDYLAFGMLCDMGFAADAGQHASFRDVTIRNSRAPHSVLFHEDLAAAPYQGIYAGAAGLSVANGQYVLDGGGKGAFLVRNPSHNSAPMLRTTFQAPKPIDRARLYVTARGVYEMYLNGRRVGDDHYNPGLTQYNVTHFYQTYDVTPLLRPGANALGAMLGEGWFSGLLSYGAIWNHFGDRQSLLAKLAITYQDGTSETIVSDPARWKYFGNGPVVYSSLDMGEIYDASRERAVAGWSTAAYADAKWKPAVAVPLEGTTFSGAEAGRGGMMGPAFAWDKLSLIGQIGDNARVYRILAAKSVKEVRPGVFVYNLGQNMVG